MTNGELEFQKAKFNVDYEEGYHLMLKYSPKEIEYKTETYCVIVQTYGKETSVELIDKRGKVQFQTKFKEYTRLRGNYVYFSGLEEYREDLSYIYGDDVNNEAKYLKFVCSMSDKHFYREDREEEFSRAIFFKITSSGDLVEKYRETKWYKRGDGPDYSLDPKTGKIVAKGGVEYSV